MRRSSLSLLAVVAALVVGAAACGTPAAAPPLTQLEERPAPRSVADLDELPAGATGDAIVRGRAIAERTDELVRDHVGNELRCTSCHLGGGATANAASWVGATKRYPQHRARSGKVDTIEDRMNDCFERSMDGTALDPDSAAMKDLVAYMEYLSRDVPEGGAVADARIPLVSLSRPPDREHGREIWGARCHGCHGPDGEGVRGPDGKLVFPAVAGPSSFNIGAGMARQRTAAGFIRHNMPLGQGGTLTDAEAWDVAGFIETLPRPDFDKKHLDWPQGGKPPDARY
jgi:thiosulfate dehydrogenase